MAGKGTYTNPTDKSCFELCTSCFRCQARHPESRAKCRGCSGHDDPRGDIDPHPLDICYCTQGILRWVSKKGQIITKKFPNNPFEGDVKVHTESKDEQDWKMWLREQRERLNDPNWEPMNIYDTGKDPNAGAKFKK